jgi:hypothetical protein
VQIESGPIQTYGLRFEANGKAVKFERMAGRNYILGSRLSASDIADQSVPGSNNLVQLTEDGGAGAFWGTIKASIAGVFQYGASAVHEFLSPYKSPTALFQNDYGAGYDSDVVRIRATATPGLGFNLLAAEAGGKAAVRVLGNGNVQNANNSYGAHSDLKLKRDVVAAGSQLGDVKSLARAMSKFRLKADPAGQVQLGWVAQDVVAISPGLVYATPDRDADGNALGTETLGIHYSVANLKAFKAVGELIEQVEKLEARVAALERS